ncbi:MAG: hypothetical protein ABI131_02165 [Nostocoides sp.]
MSLIGALLAAVAYGIATVAQAVGVRRLAALPRPRGIAAVVRAGWPYAAGLSLDLAGFLASISALRRLPLFLVQSAVASSIAVTAVLGAVVLGHRLSRRERLAVAGVVAGLALLAVTAVSGPATRPGRGFGLSVTLSLVVVAGLLVWGVTHRGQATSVPALSVAAGLAFGVVGVAARTLAVPHPLWHLVLHRHVWLLAVAGVLGTIAYAVALERGSVTSVAAICFSVETLLPAAVGLVWLGDGVRAGWWPVTALGFAATLGGCLTLAGRAEPTLVGDAGPGPTSRARAG